MDKIKKEQLKKAIKPVVLECFRELIFEENILSTILSEAFKVSGNTVLTESKPALKPVQKIEPKPQQIEELEKKEENSKLEEAKRRMLQSSKLKPFSSVFESFTEADFKEPEQGMTPQDEGVVDFVNKVVNPNVIKDIIKEENLKKNHQFSDAPSMKHQVHSQLSERKAQIPARQHDPGFSTLPDVF